MGSQLVQLYLNAVTLKGQVNVKNTQITDQTLIPRKLAELN